VSFFTFLPLFYLLPLHKPVLFKRGVLEAEENFETIHAEEQAVQAPYAAHRTM